MSAEPTPAQPAPARPAHPEPAPAQPAHPEPATLTPTVPTATYRLQLHADFTFADAEEVVPYLADLGVSHLYLSPVLAAVPGSEHGYDVVDHTRISPDLGGREGLERLAAVTREHGLGIVVDVVPNHMALVAPQWRTRPVWQVLREGPTAATAHWFDVDWAALDGRFGLPLLGSDLATELADGTVRLDVGSEEEGPAAGQPVVRYHDHVLPVAPGTEAAPGETVADVLGRQHYLLAGWQEADRVLNYRRFFEVDGLIGVRVEETDVFTATHELLLDLHHAGVIDGFRIDHPDGLADPQGYLTDLARRVRPGTPVWVEKILEGQERLPASWDCAGTTGYDAHAALQLALVDPATTGVIDEAWGRAGGEPDLHPVVVEAKREAVERLLGPEVGRLVRLARRVLPDEDPAAVRSALAALLVEVDVYRVYVRPDGSAEPGANRPLAEAVERATMTAGADVDLVRRLGVMLGAGGTASVPASPPAVRDPGALAELIVRFQQTTGPVMAKGIEDTAFYRWHRLVALNEVGADPSGPVGPEALHEWAVHQAEHWPVGMTTLSTHDTKRSEDVRARVLAVAGDAAAWLACTDAFAAAATKEGVDGPTAHLLWQTLVGVGEVSERRLLTYLTKAMREGKQHTTWVEPDEAYEARVTALARRALTDPALRGVVRDALARSEAAIRAVTLAQKLLQLTLPGVPDTYQGTAAVDLSLVDPDNRRPVDYPERVQRLARLDAGERPRDLDDEMLLVTSRTLRLRRRLPEAVGPGAGYGVLSGGPHLLGFVRGRRVAALAVRAPHGLAQAGGWAAQSVDLPAGRWVDELTGAARAVGPAGLRCAEAFEELPVALLVREKPADTWADHPAPPPQPVSGGRHRQEGRP